MLINCFLLLMLVVLCIGIFDIPEMRGREVYRVAGDINVGVIMGIRHSAEGDNGPYVCGNINAAAVQRMELYADAVRDANDNRNVLPGIKMGFTILDDCSINRLSTARAIQFIPTPEASCHNVATNSSTFNAHAVDPFPLFPVDAVIASSSSDKAVLISNVLNTYKIPVLGNMATSEELSDKYVFPYFARTVPSDFYQARAIVDLMIKYQWTYVSMISSIGKYGDSGASAVKQLTEENGICIAYAVSVHSSYSDDFFQNVANSIIANEKSNVIVLYIHTSYAEKVINKLKGSIPVNRKLIFLCSDGVYLDMFNNYPDFVRGSFLIELYGTYVDEEFYKTWDSIGPYNFRNDETNYFKNIFEEHYNCSTENETIKMLRCNESLTLSDIINYKSDWASIYLAPMLKMIEATHIYFKAKCPEVFDGGYSTTYIQKCIDRQLLFEYIERTITISNRRYRIHQLQERLNTSTTGTVMVGTWEMTAMALKLNDSLVNWNSPRTSEQPDSICSYACEKNQFRIQLEQRCCWECRYCNNNEIVVKNGSNCEKCPEFHWPDKETSSFCYAIEYSHYEWDSSVTIVIAVISTCGVVLTISTLVYFLKNRKTRLIKATGLSLSLVTLLGVFMSFPSALLMVAPPNNVLCAMSSVGMHLGLCITYSSLLMKTNRIYRVFRAAKHSAKMPKYTRNSIIIFFALILVTFQIFILTVTMFMFPLKTSLNQPIINQELVELRCDLSAKMFIPPLGFNLILIIFCSVYAVKTRKLPDNFNESKLIFLLVLATCFLWMAFLPTYFAAQDSQQKAGLLAMLLLISGILTILCLFAPKIYATIYIDDLNLKTNKIGSSCTQAIPSKNLSN